ncbi:MAG: MaoC family dehydratase [Dehalococcoidia bacterium]|nr:MaoC family dehydratase [Dehalococcoidia bacterium]
MDQRYFEDVEPGDEIETPWDATPEAVAEFMATRRLASGLPEIEDGPERVRPGFERPIVPGSMSLAVLSRLVTDWMGSRGRLRSISASYRRPVYRDDQLRALALVTDTEKQAEGGGLVKLDVYIENERGERPLQGVAVVELPLRP